MRPLTNAPIFRYARVFHNWRLKKATVLPYLPEDISIETTNVCNFKCHYCPQSDPTHHEIVPRTSLTPEQARILLSRLRDGGVKTQVLHWTLDGEPFINKRFDQLCKIAHEYRFITMVFSTNGSLATVDRLLKFPRAKGCEYTLCVDFCADKEMFETYRGTIGSWEIVRANILGIVGDTRLPHIRFRLTDISSYKVQDQEELKRRFDALRGLFQSERVTVVSRVFHNATGFVRWLPKKESVKYNLCPYPWMSLVVASNGDVVACCRDLRHKTVLGNLFHQGLIEIWNGDKYQQLRSSLVNQCPEGACENCDMPYDQAKFSSRHMVTTGLRRLKVLD